VGSFVDKRQCVGVVTVAYNSGGVIDDFMRSILEQTYADFILYVIDNASTDDTLPRLSTYADPRIVPIASEINTGVAEGNNIGIRAAIKDGCGLVLLINNDTVFDSDLLLKLVEGLRQHDCEMIVPKILFFDEPEKIWSAGGYFSRLRGAAGHYGFDCKDDGRFDVPRIVAYSPTCCMLIRCGVFDRVGLMDANYFVYFDDTDFCWRAYMAGMKLMYLPAARLRHKVGSLTKQVSNFAVRYYTRNHVYFILKHRSLFFIPFVGFVYYCYLAAKYLLWLQRAKLFLVAQRAFWEGVWVFVSAVRQSKQVLAPTRVR
jgi:hypothetical protein